MDQEPINKLADAFKDEDCYDIKETAAELGLSVQRTRQLIEMAIEKRKLQVLIKKKGPKNLYAPPMVEALKAVYLSGEIVKPSTQNRRNWTSKSALNRAEIVIEVPIFDKEVMKVLLGKHGSAENIREYLRTKLTEETKPVLQKLREIDERAEREKAALLGQG